VKAIFSDSWNYISTLSFRKIWNVTLNYSSYFFTIIFRKPFHWGMPVSASIEATTSCNLKCPECPSGLRKFTRPTGTIDPEHFQKYIDPLSKNLLFLMLYFQGEPYLNKTFFDLVKYAKTKNIYTATSSNGHFLNDENARNTIESRLDRLIISLDGTDQESYESYRRGGDFDKVITGIKTLVEYKKKLKSKKPFIILQFLVQKNNEHQLAEIADLSRQLDVDKLELKTAQFYDFKNSNPLMPTNTKYSRYSQNTDGTFSLKMKIKNRCLRMWQSLVITWDGKVVPCCFDKDAQHQLGDLNNTSLKKIWNSSDYDAFRKNIFSNRKKIDICCNCTE